MRRRFQIVDVFSATPFSGNPVAVLLDAEGLATDDMQQITRWMNLSETTFLLTPESDDADYRARIFTLDREMPFAGHPTLGSCAAWLDAENAVRDPLRVVQECGAGLVPIRRQAPLFAFAAPPLLRSGPVDDAMAGDVCEFLRIERDQVVDMAWIDNGPGWLGVLLGSAAAVKALAPAAAYPRRMDVGVVGLYPPGGDAQLEIRALFSDHNGAIREDPVTGSLNASIAQWLLQSERVTAPYVATQGASVGRSGRITIEQDASGEIWVGGNANVLVRGDIDA